MEKCKIWAGILRHGTYFIRVYHNTEKQVLRILFFILFLFSSLVNLSIIVFNPCIAFVKLQKTGGFL